MDKIFGVILHTRPSPKKPFNENQHLTSGTISFQIARQACVAYWRIESGRQDLLVCRYALLAMCIVVSLGCQNLLPVSNGLTGASWDMKEARQIGVKRRVERREVGDKNLVNELAKG